MSRVGFKLGDHQFLHPSQNGPLSRLREPKRQIKGAPPPTYLDGRAEEARPDSPVARDLFEGGCCGHGEPTMTIFEVVIDGHRTLELGAVMDEEDEAYERNMLLMAVRAPGSDRWFALFRREWEDAMETLTGVTDRPLTPEEVASIHPDIATARVAIGFEYPCDADSRDCVSWLTIDALFEGDDEPRRQIDAELA